MKGFVRLAMALATVAMFAPVVVEAQGKPVIAVLYFENSSIGKDRADYEGIGKGIADMLITDMALNPNVRIVERERIQALITEQNLTKERMIDPQTAVRLGKIVGAQYMITGGFMSDGRGTFVLTARAINVETSAITNPTKLVTKGDDVLGLIAQLSTKLNSEMRLPALQVGDAGSAMPAGEPAAAAAPAPAPARIPVAKDAMVEAKPAEAKPAEHPHAEAKPAPKPAMHVAEAKPKQKMDLKTAMLYSKALEEEDAGNRTKAVELYRQVVAKFPLPAAQSKIEKLSRS